MDFFKCDCSKKKPKKVDGEESKANDINFKKKWSMSDIATFLSLSEDLFKYTDEVNYRYIISSIFFNDLCKYSKG